MGKIKSRKSNVTEGWIGPADAWIVSYMRLCDIGSGFGAETPQMFCLAHALELYLKACHSIVNPDDCNKLRESHKLFDIWKELKQDNLFLPDINIKQEHIEEYTFFNNIDFYKKYANDLNIIENANLIRSIKFVGDLKYLGVGQYKKMKQEGLTSYGFIIPETDLLETIGRIRKYFFSKINRDPEGSFIVDQFKRKKINVDPGLFKVVFLN